MRFGTSVLLAAVAAAVVPQVDAAPVELSLDGNWFDFVVGDVSDVWRSSLDGEPISFSLTSVTPFTLRLVDVGFAGDRVDVVSGGVTLLGTTSLVPTDDTAFAFSADEAFAAPSVWSQGQWLLGAGTYSFTGTAVESPFGGGAWGISALPIPEPETWAMMLAGLFSVAAIARRRR